MPLIPEARAIKDVLRDADAHAAAVAEELLGLEALPQWGSTSMPATVLPLRLTCSRLRRPSSSRVSPGETWPGSRYLKPM